MTAPAKPPLLSWSVVISRTVLGLHGHVNVKYADGNTVHHVLQGTTLAELQAHAAEVVPKQLGGGDA